MKAEETQGHFEIYKDIQMPVLRPFVSTERVLLRTGLAIYSRARTQLSWVDVASF